MQKCFKGVYGNLVLQPVGQKALVPLKIAYNYYYDTLEIKQISTGDITTEGGYKCTSNTAIIMSKQTNQRTIKTVK